MIELHFLGSAISSNSKEAYSLEKSKNLGERSGEKITYLIPEVLYLLEEKKAKLFLKEKEINFEEVLNLFSKKDKNLFEKFLVYKYLRKRGFIPKTGLKFGADFRVYEKSKKDHAKWIVIVEKENEKFSWKSFSSKSRIAHSTKKNLLIAIVDSENDILFYDVHWVKP